MLPPKQSINKKEECPLSNLSMESVPGESFESKTGEFVVRETCIQKDIPPITV